MGIVYLLGYLVRAAILRTEIKETPCICKVIIVFTLLTAFKQLACNVSEVCSEYQSRYFFLLQL
jgi:hypothetical protein